MKKAVLCLIFLFFFGLGVVWRLHLLNRNVQTADTTIEMPVFTFGSVSPSLYDRANATVDDKKRSGAKSAIVAHHLVVSDKIAQLFATLGNGSEKTVVILSPNHFSQGHSTLQTTLGTWKTPYGNLAVDKKSVELLLTSVTDLKNEPETFETEHGVNALTPFVKKWFPKAKLVPIVLHEKATHEQVTSLAKTIHEQLPDAIVIASIDMSHYLPQHIQSYHDDVTSRSITQGRSDMDLEIDANAVLNTLFEINRLRETQHWIETHHGSSLAIGATQNWRENTSHILGYFLAGAPENTPFLSLHFVGDIMLDRDVRTWIDENRADYPWREVTRYLQGSHYRIGNLEGTVSEKPGLFTHDPPFIFTFAPAFVKAMMSHIDIVSLANNHADDYGNSGERETQKWLDALGLPWFGGATTSKQVHRIDENGLAVSLVGYHQFGASLEELETVIAKEKAMNRFVIVMPHWGEEYITNPQSGQRAQAKRMIAAGANLIVGGHPHVVQGIETIDNVPVIYSLGNFVFDQEFDETIFGMTLGLILEQNRATLYLSPVSTLNAQPTPLSDDEAAQIFLNRSIKTFTYHFSYDEE